MGPFASGLAPGDEPLGAYDAVKPWEQQQQVRIMAVHDAARVHPHEWVDDFGPLLPDQMEELAYQMTSVEQLSQDARRRHEAVQRWGYRDIAHFERVRLTFLKHWGRPLGHTLSEFVWDGSSAVPAMMRASERREREKMNATIGQNQDLLAPVEGVSLEAYAKVCMAASRGQFAAVAAQMGMDAAKFERVSNGWNGKMARDTTGTLTRLYAEAFTKV